MYLIKRSSGRSSSSISSAAYGVVVILPVIVRQASLCSFSRIVLFDPTRVPSHHITAAYDTKGLITAVYNQCAHFGFSPHDLPIADLHCHSIRVALSALLWM